MWSGYRVLQGAILYVCSDDAISYYARDGPLFLLLVYTAVGNRCGVTLRRSFLLFGINLYSLLLLLFPRSLLLFRLRLAALTPLLRTTPMEFFFPFLPLRGFAYYGLQWCT